MTNNELLAMSLNGIVRAHSCQVKQDKDDTVSHRLDIKIDFTGWTVQDVIDMAVRPLVIARQRVWREMSVEQLKHENVGPSWQATWGRSPRLWSIR